MNDPGHTFRGLDIEAIFSERGLLSSTLRGYEYREGQFRMAESVLEGMGHDRTMIIEAGTGVGKSLAYLVPLALWLSEADPPRAIVSTYTKALQKQLFEKELPFIKKHFFPSLRYALSFGSDNYLCLRRLEQARQHGLFDAGEISHIPEILRRVQTTATGLRGEFSLEPNLWLKVCRESDTCSGRKCRFYHGCFYQTAKGLERKANIIVTNHHLFFAHVASNYTVLPDARCLVLDEAHEVEDVASDHLCIRVSNYQLRSLLDSILSPRGRGLLARLPWLDTGRLQDISAMVERVRRAGELFFMELESILAGKRSLRLHDRMARGDELSGALGMVQPVFDSLSQISEDEEERIELQAISRRIEAFRENLKNIERQDYGSHVYWASQEGRFLQIAGTPLNVSNILRERVFSVFRPSLLTSATLSTGGAFDYVQAALGLESAETALFPSPFDYRKQAILYIPETMPEPNSAEYAQAVAGQVDTFLTITGGRTMVLFTSYSLLSEVAGLVRTDCRLLKQGDRDTSLLLEEFRQEQAAVLFGTYSFWQGIDLKGDCLKCVVITRLPFSVPTEPVVEARMEKMLSEGRDPFREYQVPNAVTLFRQGFGRLIRSRNDQGIVAVLDTRIINKSYGRSFLSSLPKVEITADLERVSRFYKEIDSSE